METGWARYSDVLSKLPLGRLRQKLVAITDRFAGFEAQSLNVHADFPLFQRMALPVMAGKTKIAGIKIHSTDGGAPTSITSSSRPAVYLQPPTRLHNSATIFAR